MKNSEKFERAFNYFKKTYAYKMGGTQTVILPNGKSKHFDDREYYSGRGKKYNSSIRHDKKGDVKVSRKEYSDFLQYLREKEQRMKEHMAVLADKAKRYDVFKNKGVYELKTNGKSAGYVVLSDEEMEGQFFDAERLAETFDISVEDVKLLKSGGKTYVYAKNYHGETVELYHSSLDCNSLAIHFEWGAEKKYQEMLKDRKRWTKAPYAGMVGQTGAMNHFVC